MEKITKEFEELINSFFNNKTKEEIIEYFNDDSDIEFEYDISANEYFDLFEDCLGQIFISNEDDFNIEIVEGKTTTKTFEIIPLLDDYRIIESSSFNNNEENLNLAA